LGETHAQLLEGKEHIRGGEKVKTSGGTLQREERQQQKKGERDIQGKKPSANGGFGHQRSAGGEVLYTRINRVDILEEKQGRKMFEGIISG